ncbi:MAG: ABC transporter ATP-binding protein [Anaerolineae bacterium]|nr:ABC transporter ATP-binding protein [Anaerolineae bacterium]
MNPSTTREPAIHLQNVCRVYHLAGENIHAVNDVTLDVGPGVMTAIVGRSGSGKTTLLNLIAGLDDPTGGTITVLGRGLHTMNERERLDLRLHKLGFIFQSFGLMPLLSARENIGVPLRMRGLPSHEREDRVDAALEWVGLSERAHHRPYELSGGEQQRVAIARAIAEGADLVLADEPTGQLDTRTGRRILDLLRRLVTERGITLLIATHDPQVMAEADIVHEMRDGKLIATRVRDQVKGVDR